MVLFPRKSVTAIIGITNKERSKDKCKDCNKFKDVAIEKGIRGVDVRELIKERVVIFDGAMGTMLQKED